MRRFTTPKRWASLWFLRFKNRTYNYCPVCGILLEPTNEGWNHGFAHSLNDWQVVYDAEDFVANFLGMDEFYEKYQIINLDTRKMLLQVGLREGVDRGGREATGGGTRETAIALLNRANEALGVRYVQDFTDKEGHDRKRTAIMRSRLRSRENTRAKNRFIVKDGRFTIESERFREPTRDIWEKGVIKVGELHLGRFRLDIPYRSKSLTRLIPSQVKIDWFEIRPGFRRKGYGRRCYEVVQKMILERYDPDELTLKTAVWNVKGFWEKMGFSLLGKYSGEGKRYSMRKKV